ncbi:MAG: succinylglutamate desuccinylase [Janthinobacterium lividum]
MSGGLAAGQAAERASALADGQAGLWRPDFSVAVPTPDISPWIAGNTGLPGFTTLEGAADGPHVVLVALTHGNETAGAAALDRLLRAGVRPQRGRLTLGFANLDAFQRFDPAQPTATRFLDEDLNRLWDLPTLEGSRSSRELERARAMRPVLEQADLLLDLHSMLWPSDPLILSGPAAKGGRLAAAIGTPPLVVADEGHLGGRRLIDFAPFADPDSPQVAVLVEAGQHWQPDTVDTTLACIEGLLRHAGMLPPGTASSGLPGTGATVRRAEVTMTVTAATAGFAFTRPFRGGEVIAAGDTLIATDGTAEVRTPYDDCLLVMPSLRPSRGHTAVRLARFT